MNQNLKAHLALLIVALLYGANYSIAKVVMQDNLIHPFAFIMIRVSCGFIFFLLFHRLFVREKVAHKDFFLLILCGLFGVATNQLLFFAGLQQTSPIHASLLMITTPLLVLAISSVILKNKLTKFNILGIIIGAIGAVLLISDGQNLSFGTEYIKGDVKIFLNAVSYALYLVLVKKLLAKYSPFTVTKWIFLFGFLMVIPFGLPHLMSWDTTPLTTDHYLAILYVVIGTTIMAYLFNAFALSKLKPTTVGAYIYLQPLIAGIISVTWGQDSFTVTKLAAGILIFSGVIIASKKKKDLHFKTF